MSHEHSKSCGHVCPPWGGQPWRAASAGMLVPWLSGLRKIVLPQQAASTWSSTPLSALVPQQRKHGRWGQALTNTNCTQNTMPALLRSTGDSSLTRAIHTPHPQQHVVSDTRLPRISAHTDAFTSSKAWRTPGAPFYWWLFTHQSYSHTAPTAACCVRHKVASHLSTY